MVDLTHREYRILFRLAYDGALSKVSDFDQRLRYYDEAPKPTLPHSDYIKVSRSSIDVLSDPQRHINMDIKHCKEWSTMYRNIAEWLEQFLATVNEADDVAWVEGIREYLNLKNRSKS